MLFLQNTSCIRRLQIISRGRVCTPLYYTLPLDPPLKQGNMNTKSYSLLRTLGDRNMFPFTSISSSSCHLLYLYFDDGSLKINGKDCKVRNTHAYRFQFILFLDYRSKVFRLHIFTVNYFYNLALFLLKAL